MNHVRVAIFVFDGVDELDVVGPFEVFRDAAKLGAQLSAELVAIDRNLEIYGSHGLRFYAEKVYDGGANVLLIPGGGYSDRAKRGVRHEIARGDLPRIILEAFEAGKIIASVCTGAMLVAASKIGTGRRMTTHHAALDDLKAEWVQVVPERVVDDGNIVSGGGVTSGIDLALHLVKRFAGADFAETVASGLEYPLTGSSHSASALL